MGGAEVVAARLVFADQPIGDAVDVDVLNRARPPGHREPVQGSGLAAAELRPDGNEVVLGDQVKRLDLQVLERAVQERGGVALWTGCGGWIWRRSAIRSWPARRWRACWGCGRCRA